MGATPDEAAGDSVTALELDLLGLVDDLRGCAGGLGTDAGSGGGGASTREEEGSSSDGSRRFLDTTGFVDRGAAGTCTTTSPSNCAACSCSFGVLVCDTFHPATPTPRIATAAAEIQSQGLLLDACRVGLRLEDTAG